MTFWQDQSTSHWFSELFSRKRKLAWCLSFLRAPFFWVLFLWVLAGIPQSGRRFFLAMDLEFSFSPPSSSFCSLVYSKSNEGLTQNPFRGERRRSSSSKERWLSFADFQFKCNERILRVNKVDHFQFHRSVIFPWIVVLGVSPPH